MTLIEKLERIAESVEADATREENPLRRQMLRVRAETIRKAISTISAPADPQRCEQDLPKSCHQPDLSIEGAQQADPQLVDAILPMKPGQYLCDRCKQVAWGGDHVCPGARPAQPVDATYNQGVRDAMEICSRSHGRRIGDLLSSLAALLRPETR